MPIVTPGTYTLAALTSEVNADPLGLGLATPRNAGQFQGVADILNAIPEPIAAGSQESIFKKMTLTTDLIACIVAADYTALTVTQRDLCALVFSTEMVKTGDAATRTLLASIFAVSTTRTALIAASSRLCSRAEALWGDGTQISAEQVANALGHF
jgi:hypothetical protein